MVVFKVFSFLNCSLSKKKTFTIVSIPSESEFNSGEDYLPLSDVEEDGDMLLENIPKGGKLY